MNAAQQSDRMPASWCSRCRGHVHATAISGWSAVGESVRLRLFLDILPLHPLLIATHGSLPETDRLLSSSNSGCAHVLPD